MCLSLFFLLIVADCTDCTDYISVSLPPAKLGWDLTTPQRTTTAEMIFLPGARDVDRHILNWGIL